MIAEILWSIFVVTPLVVIPLLIFYNIKYIREIGKLKENF